LHGYDPASDLRGIYATGNAHHASGAHITMQDNIAGPRGGPSNDKASAMKSLHLAAEEDADKLLPLVAAFHAEMGFGTDAEHHAMAIAPLLGGSPHGAIWLIGPRRAPVGYIVLTFGWSVEFGGLDASVDEIFVRPAVRGRGMGQEALSGIAKAMKDAGVRALHLEVDREDENTQRFYHRARFENRDRYMFMSRIL
jgi:ribosomal protein S18 acetylase RimI-like enzyme